MRIALDVGHGSYRVREHKGFDTGALGNNKTEYELNKIQAQEAYKQLKIYNYGVDVFDYPKNCDYPLSLFQRGMRADTYDIFVSLHLNAFNTEVQGSEVLIHNQGSQFDLELAGHIQSAFINTFSHRDRGVKRKNLGVLRALQNRDTINCLTEAFFIDYPNHLIEDDTLKAGKAVARGIHNFIMDNSHYFNV